MTFVRQITTLLCAKSASSFPLPSPPLCLFPSDSPLCCCLSCLFSSHLHYCMCYALSTSAYVFVCSSGLKRQMQLLRCCVSLAFLLHSHSSLALCLFSLTLIHPQSLSFPSIQQSSRAGGRRGEVIWPVYISTALLFSRLPSHLTSSHCSYSPSLQCRLSFFFFIHLLKLYSNMSAFCAPVHVCARTWP